MSAGFVTNAGLANNVAAWAAYTALPKYLQCGTGSGQTDSSTNVASPAQARVASTPSQQTTTVAGDTLSLLATFIAGGTLAISEVGMFDAASGGSMDIYGDFNTIILGSGDEIHFTVNVTVA